MSKGTKKLGTLYLVVARAGMDDLPLLLTPSVLVAKRYANECTPRDFRAAADVLRVDTSIWCNITIVAFKGGRPTDSRIVRDITPEEAEAANEPLVKAAKRRRARHLVERAGKPPIAL